MRLSALSLFSKPKVPRHSLRLGSRLLATAVLATAACSAEHGPSAGAGTDLIRALVTIERTENFVQGGDREASALAHFAKLPADAYERDVLRATGLEPEALAPGQCGFDQTGGFDRPTGLNSSANSDSARDLVASGADGAPSPLELVDAGEVHLSADGRAVVDLAPLAFPRVNGLGSGVFYATRNRQADPFPPGASYTLSTTGSVALDRPISITAKAPLSIERLSINGVPLERLGGLPLGESVELGWLPSGAGDVVLVRLSNVATGESIFCALDDAAGQGALPAGLVAALTPGTHRLLVNRRRLRELSPNGVDVVRMQFDFGLTRQLSLAP